MVSATNGASSHTVVVESLSRLKLACPDWHLGPAGERGDELLERRERAGDIALRGQRLLPRERRLVGRAHSARCQETALAPASLAVQITAWPR